MARKMTQDQYNKSELEKMFLSMLRQLDPIHDPPDAMLILFVVLLYRSLAHRLYTLPSSFSCLATRTSVSTTVSADRDMESMPSSIRKAANSGKSEGACPQMPILVFVALHYTESDGNCGKQQNVYEKSFFVQS